MSLKIIWNQTERIMTALFSEHSQMSNPYCIVDLNFKIKSINSIVQQTSAEIHFTIDSRIFVFFHLHYSVVYLFLY